MLSSFRQDVRVGLRVLAKEKGFCALAVFVLALGIGAVTTQYAVVNGVLLHAFSFRDADRLVDVQLVDPVNFSPTNFNSRITTADFADLKRDQQSFSEFVGYLNGSTVNLTWQGRPKRLTGGYVTHDFFSALGVKPALGRDFLPEDDRPGADRAVLLSDALWRSGFGGDPGVLGRTVRVNGRAGVIVGVMPPKFHFPANEQLWIPVHSEFPVRPRSDRGINFIAVLARLKPGISLAQAEDEMTRFARRFGEEHPATNKQFSLGYVRPLIRAFTGGPLPGLLYTMLGFCAGVLLIACVNVMNMQFARATLRAKELAIRSSLGATRSRLIRQMLTESLLLAGLGAVLGVGLAFYATDWLDAAVHNLENPIPAWMRFDLDARVLGFVVGATVLSAVVSGFVPAWLASRTSALEVLKEGGRGNTGRTVGVIARGLVVVQLVVTFVLLIGALLQMQSLVKQQNLDYGYDTSAVLAARLGLMGGSYPDDDQRRRFYEALLRELRAAPQFAAAALTDRQRMVFGGAGPVEIEGRTYVSGSDRRNSQVEHVSPGYFAVLGVRLLEGRDFTDTDSDQRDRVAIVNAKFARTYFGAGSPLGRRFRTVSPDGTVPGPWRTVVGVAADVRMQGPFPNAQADGTGFYVPFSGAGLGPAAAAPVARQFGTVVVRPPAGQRPESLAAALQQVVNRVDPDLPLYFVATPRRSIDSFLTQNRVVAVMFGFFGFVAVLLAAVGLYGVTSFSVNQRTAEFGIRLALGASPSGILRLVLRQGTRQLTLGLGVGLALALGFALLFRDGIARVLVDTSPHDPFTYTLVAALLAAVSLLATFVPARRATRVDPMTALRTE